MPATVVSRLGPLSYLVEISDSKLLFRRHVDHIKSRVVKAETRPTSSQELVEDDPPESGEAGFELSPPAESNPELPSVAEREDSENQTLTTPEGSHAPVLTEPSASANIVCLLVIQSSIHTGNTELDRTITVLER